MDRKIVEKFFNNTCTPKEAKKILAWFRTQKGKEYLEEKLDEDLSLLQDEWILPLVPDIRSNKIWDTIEEKIESGKKRRYLSGEVQFPFWRVAAVIFIILIPTIFLVWSQMPAERKSAFSQSVVYTVGKYQQKALTLSDGTRIRLNGNAQIWIPEDYGRSSREVKLEGEAYFEVIHKKKLPFIIHTAHVSIKDLGTRFCVRALPAERNVQVAVADGKVSVWSNRQTEKEATELSRGQFGYVDLKRRTMQVDKFGVSNYLSWINGRLKFDRAPLSKVSMQLARIYNVSFVYSNTSLKRLTLTADFERKSLKKVLEVISLTLHIDYQIKDDKVTWLQHTH